VVLKNIHTPTTQGHWEILRRRGVLKAKTVKGMNEPKQEFPEGWGLQTEKKPLCTGSMDIFWKKHIDCH